MPYQYFHVGPQGPEKNSKRVWKPFRCSTCSILFFELHTKLLECDSIKRTEVALAVSVIVRKVQKAIETYSNKNLSETKFDI